MKNDYFHFILVVLKGSYKSTHRVRTAEFKYKDTRVSSRTLLHYYQGNHFTVLTNSRAEQAMMRMAPLRVARYNFHHKMPQKTKRGINENKIMGDSLSDSGFQCMGIVLQIKVMVRQL